jgi:hypothetical protein
MRHEILNNFTRMGLHDSHFSDIKIDTETISIKIDWGYLENYHEGNISEPIVFGDSVLTLFDIQSQVFLKLTDDKPIQIEMPDSIKAGNWLINTNGTVDKDSLITMTFSMTNDFREYLEWTITFKHGRLTWDEFILHKNWLTGQESLSQ